jgi:hemerythrin-like domain-containing protein
MEKVSMYLRSCENEQGTEFISLMDYAVFLRSLKSHCTAEQNQLLDLLLRSLQDYRTDVILKTKNKKT